MRLEAIATLVIVALMGWGTFFIAGSVPVLGLGWASFLVTVLCGIGMGCIGYIWSRDRS